MVLFRRFSLGFLVVVLLVPLHAKAQRSGALGDPSAADQPLVPPPPGATPAPRQSTPGASEAPSPALREAADTTRSGTNTSAAGTTEAVPPPPQARTRQRNRQQLRLPNQLTTRIRALDASLQALAARGGGGNLVNAILSLVTGGLTITLGVLSDNDLSIYLYIYGSVAATRGVLDFILHPNPSQVAVQYQLMPMNNRSQADERLAFGERALENLAEQAMIARIVDASLNLAAGAIVIPAYLAPQNFEIDDPLDYFVLIGAAASLIGGIVTLATNTNAERRWATYEELRERLGASPRTEEANEEARLWRQQPNGPSLRFGWGTVSGTF